MHAELQHPRPQHDSRNRKDKTGANTNRLEGEDPEDARPDPDQCADVDAGRVEDRYDDYGADVVDDGDGQQEDAQCSRDSASQQREDPDGEGDIGRHRHAPSCSSGTRSVERKKQEGRDQHATQSRGHGQGGPLEPRQCSFGKLSFDFQANDQKENRHQKVVDPEMQIPLEDPTPQSQADWSTPQCVIAFGPWRVRPHDGDDCRRQEDDAAARLDAHEPFERLGDGLCQSTGAWPGFRWGRCDLLVGCRTHLALLVSWLCSKPSWE